MSENDDKSQKTEEPTPKKLREAREKGQVATSREINNWFMLLAMAIIFAGLVPSLATGLVRALTVFVESPDAILVDSGGLRLALENMFTEVGLALLPATLLLVVAALASGSIQNGLILSTESIKPKLEKISLIKGFGRLFSVKAAVEFVKGVIKIAIVGTVATLVLLPEFDSIGTLPTVPLTVFLEELQSLAVELVIAVLAVMTVIAVLDLLFQRIQHNKEMRMSRHEIKEEMKQTDGDPHVKARMRQIRHERARRRMMAAVPDADVVITNPTHFAVALAYQPDEMKAPRLVAKGADLMAQRIRDLAEEHDVPIVENPPLARALFSGVEIDEEVPPQHYKAVAEIISYVFQLRGWSQT